MRIEINTDVNYDVEEIIDIMDENEKLAMYNELAEELEMQVYKEEFDVAKYFGGLSLYEQKKILCNALGIPNYHDKVGLRVALEKIIQA